MSKPIPKAGEYWYVRMDGDDKRMLYYVESVDEKANTCQLSRNDWFGWRGWIIDCNRLAPRWQPNIFWRILGYV